MTDHLPECWAKHESDPPSQECICERLKQAENYARIAVMHTVDVDSYEQGQRDALDAAVQRVEALKPKLWITQRDGGYDCCGCNTLDELYEDCIDAIKGDQP